MQEIICVYLCSSVANDSLIPLQFNTYVSSPTDIAAVAQIEQIREVLIEPTLLARTGTLSLDEADSLAALAHAHGLRPILVWDALMPERLMQQVVTKLNSRDLSLYGAVRVADPGAAFWLWQERPEIPIQLLVETGSHNLEALRGWVDLLTPSLERLILSIELPEEQLIAYCQALPVACEVLGIGRILLFYSPRSLLATHLGDNDAPSANVDMDALTMVEQQTTLPVTAVAHSQKSPQRAFPTVETAHGTLMYLDRDQFILDRLDGLRAGGLHTVRLDLRHVSPDGHAAAGIDALWQQLCTDPSQLRAQWPHPTRAPFFKTNRTTAQFSHMKSPLHAQRDASCLAEIVAGENGRYVVYRAMRDFPIAQVESIVLATGEEVEIPPQTPFRDRDGQIVQQVQVDQLLVTNWIKKAVAGSLLKGKPSL